MLVTFMSSSFPVSFLFLALSTYSPEIYIQLVTLFTTIAMMNKNKIPTALTHLRGILNDENQIVKVLGFKLLFTLCQE